MSEPEAIVQLRSAFSGTAERSTEAARRAVPPPQVSFDRLELNTILTVYGHHVAAGNWRDYAIDFGRDKAVFSIFRRASECPLFRVEKNPKLARKQGAYAIVDQTGRIVKRGHDLAQVLKAIALKPKLSVV